VVVNVVDTAGGYFASVKMDEYTHKIVIDERPGIVHSGMIYTSGATSDGANEVIDTGIDFPINSTVLDVDFQVTTVVGAGNSAGSICVGLLSTESGGDDDGFIKRVNGNVLGFETRTLTNSGAFMDDATNYYPGGKHITSGARSLVYEYTSDIGVGAGYIHYSFLTHRN
jgi:hypothetical protein